MGEKKLRVRITPTFHLYSNFYVPYVITLYYFYAMVYRKNSIYSSKRENLFQAPRPISYPMHMQGVLFFFLSSRSD